MKVFEYFVASDKVMNYFSRSESDLQTEAVISRAAGSRDVSSAKLVLTVYAMNDPAIESALQRVEQLCKDTEKTRVVHHGDVSKLSQDQVTVT